MKIQSLASEKVKRRKNMFSKVLKFITALAVFGSSFSVSFCEENNSPVTVDNETRTVSLSAETIQYPGTVASISVWLPGFSAESFSGNLEDINAYIGEAVVSSEKKIEKTFRLKESAPSGRYVLNLFVPGLDAPESYPFDYRNVARAKSVLGISKSGSAAEIKSALDDGINDVNVEAAVEYFKYGENQKNYIAANIEKNRPADMDDFQNKLMAEINKINKTAELSKMDRENMKKTLEGDPQLYMINDKMAEYNALTDGQKEILYTYLSASITECVFPEDVAKAFESALLNAKKQQEPSTPSKPGGSSGGGGGAGGGGRGSYGGNVTGYDNSLIPEPEKNPAPETANFSDLVGAEWAKNAINILADKKIINGKEEGKFCPDDFVTREEFLKMTVGGFYIKPASVSTLPFSDVTYGEWYYNSVMAAYQYNIVKGISETEFGIGRNISRQDIAVILYNTLNVSEKSFENYEEKADFPDFEKIAEYAQKAVKAMQNAGIINGRDNNEFAPEEPATRAEAAKMLYQVMYEFNMF